MKVPIWLRGIARRLPPPILNRLKRAYVRLETKYTHPEPLSQRSPSIVLGVFANEPDLTSTGVDPKNPFSFVPEEMLRHLDNCYRGTYRNELLQLRLVRELLAHHRMLYLAAQGAPKRYAGETRAVAANTIDYNIEGAITAAALDRPSIMFDVVKAIERVHKNIGKLDVLSVGPRSEIEIFGMMAAGFHPNRIKAVDLFSYSPYVETGDMHDLPYADDSFDIIFLGWVLSYSRDQSIVARELMRVGRERAIIVLAGDYSDESRDRPTFENETTHMQSCEQLLALFGDRVGKVYFRHDPEPPDVAMVMTVFEILKS